MSKFNDIRRSIAFSENDRVRRALEALLKIVEEHDTVLVRSKKYADPVTNNPPYFESELDKAMEEEAEASTPENPARDLLESILHFSSAYWLENHENFHYVEHFGVNVNYPIVTLYGGRRFRVSVTEEE